MNSEINDLSNLFNNMTVDIVQIEQDIAYKAIIKDLESLSESFICNIEPQLSCEYNEFYDHQNFNIYTMINILNNEYQNVVKKFIEINKSNKSDCMLETNNIYTYIDYYIDSLKNYIS